MRSLKNINLAFLPIGGTYVMDLDEAIEATMLIKPRYVVPMHQASRSLLDFKHKLSQVSDSESIVLYPGESYKISVK
jgi:L-ascorbate metabolism protein UlaG (beta-lactamase superfamily)